MCTVTRRLGGGTEALAIRCSILAALLLSIHAIRPPVPQPSTIRLTRDLSPADVVEAQLVAFAAEDLKASFGFASPANRRSRGTRYEQILADPAYNVLIGHSKHRIVSALPIGPNRYSCRVHIRPSEASLQCMSATATVDVGRTVHISNDVLHVRRCFGFIQYQYDAAMEDMCGKELEVVCRARENRGTNIVGLPSPDGSQDGVWYFPVTVLEREALSTEGGADGAAAKEEEEENQPLGVHTETKEEQEMEVKAEATSQMEEGEEPGNEGEDEANEEFAFRWELRRQSDNEIAFDLGDLILHGRQGYRGVIIGFDDRCVQTENWIIQMGVDSLPEGREQPFYHVLVDGRDRPGDQITYVAQENVLRAAAEGEFPGEPVQHRLVTSLLKADSYDAERCRYEPLPQLREMYPADVVGCWMVDAVTAE